MFGLDLLIWLFVVVFIVGVLLWAAKYSGFVPEPFYRFLVIAAVVIVAIMLLQRLGFLH